MAAFRLHETARDSARSIGGQVIGKAVFWVVSVSAYRRCAISYLVHTAVLSHMIFLWGLLAPSGKIGHPGLSVVGSPRAVLSSLRAAFVLFWFSPAWHFLPRGVFCSGYTPATR